MICSWLILDIDLQRERERECPYCRLFAISVNQESTPNFVLQSSKLEQFREMFSRGKAVDRDLSGL